MKAEPARQLKLLDLQAVDTRLAQIAHRKAHLPEQKAVDEATAAKAEVDTDLVKARTRQADVSREVAKAEADVQLVRDRADRDRARLEAGSASAKELTSLQHELDSLARRQAELEDDQLEIMERAEAGDALLAHLESRAAELAAKLAEVTTSRDAAVAELDAEEAQVRERRAGIVPEVGDDLVALYDKILAQTGMGAAAVVERRCEGCRLELLGAEAARVKAAAPDEIVRCEECRRIMVRTAESGL